MKHLIDLDDFSLEELNGIIEQAVEIEKDPMAFHGRMTGRILGTLFYEPSTRTQMSFQTAMLRLGGQIVGFDDPQTASVSKGENLKDTVKVVSNYADIIAIRHPLEGSAKAAAQCADCPIINAGDGGHLHPTQTLTDLVTLMCEKGRLDNLTIGLCGDLKFGRTVHSLIKTMLRYPNNRFILISTPELTIPDYLKKAIEQANGSYTEISSLEEALPLLDVLYMTRIQRERFESLQEYRRQKDVYKLDCNKLTHAREDLKILHPLPRVDEIDTDVDDDPRALYFVQANHGVFARMSLILHMLGTDDPSPVMAGQILDRDCANSRCITQQERYLKHYYLNTPSGPACEYCDSHE